MIVLHRLKEDSFSDEIERRLEDLVVAHKIDRHSRQKLSSADFPYIEENGSKINGKNRIKRYLLDLEREVNDQRLMSGDECFIHPRTGEKC